ncbi:hypothetical protein [Algimonas porphyrae]
MSITSKFYAWMDLNWPIVLLSIFILCIFLTGCFAFTVWVLRSDNESAISAILTMREEQDQRSQSMIADLKREMGRKTDEIMGTVSDTAEALVEEVDERQAERTSFLTDEHDG